MSYDDCLEEDVRVQRTERVPTAKLVAISPEEHRRLLDDSRMLKQLIACGARGTKIWNKASQLLREDFVQ